MSEERVSIAHAVGRVGGEPPEAASLPEDQAENMPLYSQGLTTFVPRAAHAGGTLIVVIDGALPASARRRRGERHRSAESPELMQEACG
jgi:hypothetical protein